MRIIDAGTGGMMEKTSMDFVHVLWDELSDFDAARSDEALDYLMGKLCTLVGAWNVIWVGAVRMSVSSPNDPVKGWRPRSVHHLHPSPPLGETSKELTEKVDRGIVDVSLVRNTEGAGTFRANRLRDIVGPEWFESPYYRIYYLGLGTADAIWVEFPVNKDAESVFGVYRSPDSPPFTETERDVVAYTLRGIKWFHRQLMLSHGLLVAKAPLTQAEQRVLHLLLTGRSEKVIAAECERSYHTVHECVTGVLRKFGVNSRAELMALWLGNSS